MGGYERVGAASAPPFAPTDLANLALWLDASDTATITDAGAGAVSQWDDKSGNARHFTQGTAGSRPLTGANTQNGRNVLTFDGTGDFLALGASALGRNVQGLTAYAVLKWGSVPTAREDILTIDRNLLGSSRAYLGAGGVSQRARVGGRTLDADSLITIDGASNLTTAWYIQTGLFDHPNTDLRVYLDDAQDAANTSFQTATTTSDTNSVGAYISNATFALNGQVAEILVYHAAHDATARGQVWTYLADKWGVTL